jgi:hypothetical protein
MLAQDVTHAMLPSRQQKARSFELRAALSLANAHAVLASALEGLSPTPEFPEIAGAKDAARHARTAKLVRWWPRRDRSGR